MIKLPPTDTHATDHLANERTFLAWIRTSLGVIGLGFAIAKFGTWLREMSGQPEHIAEAGRSARSLTVGVVLIATGGLFALIAAWRHARVSRQIEQGAVQAAGSIVQVVTVIVLILTVLCAWLVF